MRKFSLKMPSCSLESLTTGVIIVLSVMLLLLYMSTDNILSAILFFAIYAYVGTQTDRLTYKLLLPSIITFVMVRSELYTSNWEGFKDKKKEVKDEKSDDNGDDHSDDQYSDKHSDKHSDDHSDDHSDKHSKKNKHHKENKDHKDKDGFANKTIAIDNDTLNSSMDTLENAVDRLEGSFDRIMSIGAKLGIDKHLSKLGSSLDITDILNQKKDLTN